GKEVSMPSDLSSQEEEIKPVMIRMPIELRERLKDLAYSKRTSVNQMLLKLLEEFVEEELPGDSAEHAGADQRQPPATKPASPAEAAGGVN
ncbi:MAG: hypothetical protein AAF589_09360, partial [Planctomycetota bacterium]